MDKHKTDQTVISRKQFIATTATGLAVTALSASPLSMLTRPVNAVKAIAFDAFAIFDPAPVFALAENLFPEKGTALSNIWRSKQFEYTWLRTAAGQYKNFREVTSDALVYAAKRIGIRLTAEDKDQLMRQYLTLNVWPDVLPALKTLKEHEIRLAFLSNMTTEMLESCIRHSKTEAFFEQIISTDKMKTYKPDPRAYQLGIDALNLKKEEIVFAAFAPWDVAGAKWFGYLTYWVNRSGAQAEELDTMPDITGSSTTELVKFITE